MMKVWTDAAEAGLLDRRGEWGSTFAYLPGALPTRSVSVTMPLRLESWISHLRYSRALGRISIQVCFHHLPAFVE